MHLTHCLSAAAVLASAFAAVTPQRKSQGLKLDFDIMRADSLLNKRSLVSRDTGNSVELDLENKQMYYLAKLLLGSDQQEVLFQIDTGSSDLWVVSGDVECSADSLSKRDEEEAVEEISNLRNRNYFGGFAAAPKASRTVKSDLDNIERRADESSVTGSPHVANFEYDEHKTYTISGATIVPGISGDATCTAYGSFNTDTSDTFIANASAPFLDIYGLGAYALGVWGQDTISFAGHNITNMTLAVVNNTNSGTGILGIGLPWIEGTYVNFGYQYENFPMRLKSSGLIDKIVYSLYLNKDDSDTGSVLFGAVDHAKYSGQLQTVPLVNTDPENYEYPSIFQVAVSGLQLKTSKQNTTVSSEPYAALLDSGTSITLLPLSVVNNLVSELSASYSEDQGAYELSCSYKSDDSFLEYDFSGAKIKVALSDLILTDNDKCYLQVEASSDSIAGTQSAILGDNFLRSAYVVYNLEDYEVSLAQAKYTEEEDIEVVSDSVPSAVKASDYSSTSLSSEVTDQVSTESGSSSTRDSGTSKPSAAGSMVVLALVICGFVGL